MLVRSSRAVRRHLGVCSALVAACALGSACGGSREAAAPEAPESRPEPGPPPLPDTLAGAPAPPILLRGVGLSTPESALYDPRRDEYLVSNVAGGDLEENDAGFISRVSPDGSVSELRFIDGASAEVVLNAPKGLALSGEELFVADISVVRSFDRNTGKPARKIAIMSASFLNDVAAAPDGTLYVSDTGFSLAADGSSLSPNGSDAIYVIDARGVVDVLIQGPDLGQPNGLLADAAGVWVVNLAGELYRVSRAGERKPVAKLPGGGLDGLVQTGTGRLVVSSWESSTVYLGLPPSQPKEAFAPMISDLKTPADLGYDTKRQAVIVPLYSEDSLYVQEVPGG